MSGDTIAEGLIGSTFAAMFAAAINPGLALPAFIAVFIIAHVWG